MTGKPHYNADRFALAASILRSYGYAVVTPIEIDRRVDPTFDHYAHRAAAEQIARFQAASMAEMATCDGVALLPGWRDSKGTMREVDMAMRLKIQCAEIPAWIRRVKGKTVSAANDAARKDG
jgi:hypothetical protein